MNVSRLSLTARLFLVYAFFTGMAGWLLLHTALDVIKPVSRQSTEETLVDTANLLAEIVGPDLKAGRLSQGDLGAILAAYGRRRPDADIWGVVKQSVGHRVYVTDRQGIVVLDSSGQAVGQDYSRWRDVYLTLRGRYGARTSQEVPGDESSTVMHVAAPVRVGTDIIGVVTIAKPNRTLQPYIDRARHRLLLTGAVIIAVALLLGALLALWLSRTIRRLTHFADAVRDGGRPMLPRLPGGELGQLAVALDSMRAQLDGKAYVERYVQTLTHELKSPVAGIRSAAELLRQDLPPADRKRFLDHIEAETARLQQMNERLLGLALVEQRRELDERISIPLRPLVEERLAALGLRPDAGRFRCHNDVPVELAVCGERFLVRQALSNLLDNAADFVGEGGHLRVSASREGGVVTLRVHNTGEPIPDFALPRLTERFYSLPRPATGRKSTGLGLNFVQEVAQLHGGALSLRNVDHGVEASLRLPAG